MSYSFRLLCWMSAGLLLCSWGASAGYIGRPASSPQSAPEGLRGYRRYFANDSLVGRPVPCTREDKICFRHNLVFFPREDRCEPVGGYIDPICYLRVNREELEQGSGRVVGSCPKYEDPCTGFRMAYDGLCYKKEIVRGVICGQNTNLSRHPLGEVECRSERAKPISVQQPEADGSCVVPDIRFPDTKRSVFFNNPFTEIQGFKNEDPLNSFISNAFQCESDQAACFSEEKVFVQGYEGCHTLLKQGPCAEEHVVALDAQAATEGRAEGTCVHVRGGCPPGHKRMLFDNQCHEDREIAIEAPGRIRLNQFGGYIVNERGVSMVFYPRKTKNTCVVQVVFSLPGGTISVLKPPCGADDKSECKLYEVVNDPPIPEI